MVGVSESLFQDSSRNDKLYKRCFVCDDVIFHITELTNANRRITICQNCDATKCYSCRRKTNAIVMFSDTRAYNTKFAFPSSQNEHFCTHKDCIGSAYSICEHSNLIFPTFLITDTVLNDALKIKKIWRPNRLESKTKYCKICKKDNLRDSISYSLGKCVGCSKNKPCKMCKTIMPEFKLNNDGFCANCGKQRDTHPYLELCHNYKCRSVVDKEDRKAHVFCRICSDRIKRGKCAHCDRKTEAVNEYGLCDVCFKDNSAS